MAERTPEELREQVRASRAQFISTELELAITFCDIALHAHDRSKAQRNTAHARQAYDAALQLLRKGPLGESTREMKKKIAALGDLLRQLGEEV